MENSSIISVLIADDEEGIRDIISFYLESEGYKFYTAKNGVEAFEIVTKNKIDFIISDIRMPGGDGLSLLDNVRKYNPEVPFVVFITGYSDVTEQDCIKKGALHVFRKPFDVEAIMQYIKETFRK